MAVGPVAIYEWQAWDGFLLTAMFPDAVKVSARIGQSAVEVERELPQAISRFCFHVDLTHSAAVPLDRPALVTSLHQRGISIVNGSLIDISKRRVHAGCDAVGLPTALAAREGEPNETLIVKTDLNYGGHPERLLKPEERLVVGLGDTLDGARLSREYMIAPRREVPGESWDRSELVIERFISNRTGLFLRAHVFLDRMVVTAAIDQRPIKETRWGIPREDFYFEGTRQVAAPPQAHNLAGRAHIPSLPGLVRDLHRFCSRIGFDFGAIDIAVDDEARCYIIDANGTPYWNRPDLDEIPQFLARNSL